ncbi:PREDICTED: replication protein A 70 kDa DNA-binding subunit A-like [Nicotiana attenuata]|uniref:replication protein A 70 kDa DNA-binding subunit A-like n=1 Tax=Nicotiana attenuata TaxID=49451 RepID=UPI0009051AE5|nr:PREDICTED: replication protein A 70 kDa DNA-binding subunit A-like [Nicotiana attenuata]
MFFSILTKIWINPTLPQSTEFKSRFLAVRQSNFERITQTSSQQSYSVRDELDKGIVLFKTIRDLVQCTEECSYWITAKLVNLELDRGWSYLACNKCTRKVDKVGTTYFCKKCNEEASSITHRYRLQVRVMDGTVFILLLLWNRDAMQLIGKSAKELKEGLVETSIADADCSYPTELDDIVYKKFMFKVIVKKENIESQVEIYNDFKIIDDDELLEEYDKFDDTITFFDGQSSSGEKIFEVNFMKLKLL